MNRRTGVDALVGRIGEEFCVMLTAFGYFSRLPMPSALAFSEARLAASGRYIPVVGLFVGLVGAAIYWLALQRFSTALAVSMSMVTTLLLTGALHEDGLADCCDAFGGGHQREDVLRIMKDSRIGAFGAIGLVLSLLIKWQALSGIATVMPLGAALWMIAAHAASRAATIVYLSTLDYARADGKARSFAKTPWSSAIVALLIGLPALFWMDTALGCLLVALGFVLHIVLGVWFKHRLNGYTGDCLGLAQQIFEIAIYLTVLGWISS